ncbi:hypothetical protein SAMN05443245_7036 [Paraburkholderia fungorum]|uniref:Uncharacterized protein n=1 Tax=Paraburkholderia fungorum TaxID=134537 RepID=A0A1H1JPG5_9BURK|nr:hypothetical protein [Paraburkholderia fungorum]SDR51842.1 hypothetical protein SAMN05443245_7036 [Paraburkholderia fungorum]
MSTQSYGPYRGCDIEVHVTPAKAHVMGGMTRRFRVSWSVSSPGFPDQEVASFPEQFVFLSEQEAFRYGENRAHTYVDSIVSAPVDRPATNGAVESRDDMRRL